MAKPKWRGYRTERGKKIDYKQDEVLPLWVNITKDGNSEYLSGTVKTTIPAGTKVVFYLNKYWEPEEQAGGANAGTDNDIPF